ncbi:MAG TPA: MBL fold metallo-hydrolase [Casimicrobiaceae bacterium]|nr:MBL fold metallo-hydrolase [Casimicrobiaceae bacterium]
MSAGTRNAGLLYPCGDAPAHGQQKEIVEGVLWIRMPMPFALDHVNLWAMRDVDGDQAPAWTLMDTGLQTLETATAWRALFADGAQLGTGRVKRVLVTHMHPDHVGMAGWITGKFGCPLWMTRLEYLNCRVLAADTGREAPREAIDFYRRAGWSADDLDTYRARFGGFGKMIHRLPDSYHRLEDGQRFMIGAHQWRVVVGAGHTPEHACFHCADLALFVSGDQVLPRISSNVSVFPTEPEADPLSDWLAAIDKIKREVPDDVLVLPAHNEPFRGLHARLDALADGHARSLTRLREALHEPKAVTELFASLFARPVRHDPSQLGLATGETIAHLNYLHRRGEIERRVDADGIARYRINERAAGASSAPFSPGG